MFKEFIYTCTAWNHVNKYVFIMHAVRFGGLCVFPLSLTIFSFCKLLEPAIWMPQWEIVLSFGCGFILYNQPHSPIFFFLLPTPTLHPYKSINAVSYSVIYSFFNFFVMAMLYYILSHENNFVDFEQFDVCLAIGFPWHLLQNVNQWHT